MARECEWAGLAASAAAASQPSRAERTGARCGVMRCMVACWASSSSQRTADLLVAGPDEALVELGALGAAGEGRALDELADHRGVIHLRAAAWEGGEGAV